MQAYVLCVCNSTGNIFLSTLAVIEVMQYGMDDIRNIATTDNTGWLCLFLAVVAKRVKFQYSSSKKQKEIYLFKTDGEIYTLLRDQIQSNKLRFGLEAKLYQEKYIG